MKLLVEDLVERYYYALYRIAFQVTKSREDAEDVAQDAFMIYYKTNKQFEDEEHIRAWLFRVTINRAKNIVGSFWHRNRESFYDYRRELVFERDEDSDLFDAVMKLPKKYRIVIHLYYFEDYSVKEISEILCTKEGTVKSQLSRARKMIESILIHGKGVAHNE